MSQKDRFRLKRQITAEVESRIDLVLPKKSQIILEDPLKQCYVFMRNFLADDLKKVAPKQPQHRVYPENSNSFSTKKTSNQNAM